MEFQENAAGWVFIGLIVATALFSIYRYLTNRLRPYHRRSNVLRKREKLALLNNNLEELKQVELEKLWFSKVSQDKVFGYLSLSPFTTQPELDAKRHSILAEITEDELILPNVHEVNYRYNTLSFLQEIVEKCRNEIIKSQYNGKHFLPESILPYPKTYLLFALHSLINKSPVKTDSQDYEVLQKILNSRVINIDASLLPLEQEENKRVGNEFLNRASLLIAK